MQASMSIRACPCLPCRNVYLQRLIFTSACLSVYSFIYFYHLVIRNVKLGQVRLDNFTFLPPIKIMHL